MSEFQVSIPDDVFSRKERDGLQFILRPITGSPPHALVLAPPASEVWTALIRHGGQIPIDDRPKHYQSILRQLIQHGMADIHGGSLPVNHKEISLSDDLGFRDPWDYQFSESVLRTPWFALWEITDECPLKAACYYCYRPKEVLGGPTMSQTKHICKQLELSEIPWVTILGGEPLIYPHLYDVIRQLRANRTFVKVITNGVLINHRNAAALGESGVNQVAISLDGLDAENHDLNRGNGAFKKSLKAIRLLQNHVPLVSISLTVTNRVFEQLEKLPEFCAGLGITEVYLSPLRITDNTRIPNQNIGPMRLSQKNRLGALVSTLNSPELSVISLRECSCGRSSVVIHSNGEVSPCPFAMRQYGNVYHEDLSEIWAKIMPVALRVGKMAPGAYCFRAYEETANREAAIAYTSPIALNVVSPTLLKQPTKEYDR